MTSELAEFFATLLRIAKFILDVTGQGIGFFGECAERDPEVSENGWRKLRQTLFCDPSENLMGSRAIGDHP